MPRVPCCVYPSSTLELITKKKPVGRTKSRSVGERCSGRLKDVRKLRVNDKDIIYVALYLRELLVAGMLSLLPPGGWPW